MNSEQNKINAITFYQTAYEGNPIKAEAWYVGKEYRQHNRIVADGPQPFIDYFVRMPRDYLEKSITFTRSAAEGDLAALHTHQVWPGSDQYVPMNFFSFDAEGKIIEHWDSIQQIPETSMHTNTMY
jgi:predicted SnoaL-like aldol condensation-catalyzing enzyme